MAAGLVGGPGQRWPAVDDDGATVVGFAAVLPLTGWSDHVGDVRLIVGPQHRGAGVGRALARHALTGAVQAGLRKLVVELPVEQEHAIDMFCTSDSRARRCCATTSATGRASSAIS